MTYYGAKELAESFRTVRKNTILIAEDIPEGKYDFKATTETRSVAHLLTHIAINNEYHHQIHAVERRTTLEGFDFFALMQKLAEDERKARSRGEIIQLLRERGEKWATWLEGLSEGFLAESVTMPAGFGAAAKSRFEMLLSVKEHEMHHRAQLMLIERLIGIVPHLTRQMQEHMARTMPAAKP